jgi:hypothetical protein
VDIISTMASAVRALSALLARIRSANVVAQSILSVQAALLTARPVTVMVVPLVRMAITLGMGTATHALLAPAPRM